MDGYIQIAIKKVKSVDVEEMRSLRKKGHRTIRFKLKPAAPKEKVPTASVPLTWIVESMEKWVATGKQNDGAFKDFISDWISGWTI